MDTIEDKICLETISETNSETLNNESTEQQNDKFFYCKECSLKFVDIEQFMSHIKELHKSVEVTNELHNKINEQWENIRRTESEILQLETNKNYNDAKEFLKSSFISIDNIKTDLFAVGDNIFKDFTDGLKFKIEAMMEYQKQQNVDVSNGQNNIKDERKRNMVCNSQKSIYEKRVKLEKKLDSDSEFSSDDNICLKEAIKLIKHNIIKEEIEISYQKNEEDTFLIKHVYYIIPERVDRKQINYMENSIIQSAIKNIMKKKDVDTKLMDKIILRRFDYEIDEVIPDNAILISEWIVSEKKNTWDTITFNDFFKKNIKKKGMIERNDISRQDDYSSSSSEKCLSIEKSKKIIKMTCKFCNHTCNNDMELFNHMLNRNNYDDLHCKQCGTVSKCKGHLFQHKMGNHSNDIEHKVYTTGQNSNGNRENHSNAHNAWHCGYCNEKYSNIESLKAHFYSDHPNFEMDPSKQLSIKLKRCDDQVFYYKPVKKDKNAADAPKCNECFRCFTSIGRLNQHIDVIHRGKTFRKKKRNCVKN